MAKKAKMKRAANGEGTIRQRSDGRWEARYTATDGRQRSIYARTEPEVKEKLKKAKAELTLGLWFEGSRATLSNWLDMWLENYARHIKPTTRVDYKNYFNNYVKPEIGTIQLARLKAMHIERMFNSMTDKGLAISTQKSCKIALSSALSSAVKHELMSSNPCKLVKLGKTQKKDLVIVDRKDIPRFVQEAKKSNAYGMAMLLLLQTGLRESELRGLRWKDVDFNENKLHVRQQINQTPGEIIVQVTKGYKTREIVLIGETVAMLKQHKKAQVAAKLAAKEWEESDLTHDLVFRSKNGRPLCIHGLYTAVKRVGARIGIEGLHPHSLRDSYAVAALRSGVDVKTIQNNLGHKDGSMTINTYIKYTDDMGRIAADKFAAYWAESING